MSLFQNLNVLIKNHLAIIAFTLQLKPYTGYSVVLAEQV